MDTRRGARRRDGVGIWESTNLDHQIARLRTDNARHDRTEQPLAAEIRALQDDQRSLTVNAQFVCAETQGLIRQLVPLVSGLEPGALGTDY